MPSKRVLTITAEFHVPEGLRHDVRFARVESAVARLKGILEGAAANAFPWADRLVVSHEWSYRWAKPDPETIRLPATEQNTVAPREDDE